MAGTEFNDLRSAVASLQTAINEMAVRYGPASGILRLQNDVERVVIDLRDLESSPPDSIRAAEAPTEHIYVPELRSDEAAWMGAQDEGLGFHSRKRTQ